MSDFKLGKDVASAAGTSSLPNAVFRQPLQFFAHFDLSVPWILRELVSLAGKNLQVTRNIQLVQSAIKEIVLEHGGAYTLCGLISAELHHSLCVVK